MLDPISLLNTKGVASFAQGLGSSLGGGPAGPSNAESGAYGSGQDNSGWAVNFSGTQTASSAAGGVPGIGGMNIAGVPWYVWALVAGAVAWKLSRKSK